MLTPKQQRFVSEYLIDLNATQAAIRCGYSAKTAKQQGSRLLSHVDICVAIAQKSEKQLQSADISASRVLEEMRRLALSDVRGLFDSEGYLRPIHTLTDEQAACIGGLEVIKKPTASGKRGEMDTVHKIKVWDKGRALEMLGKHLGLLTEKLEHSGGVDVALALSKKIVDEFYPGPSKA